jgi:hypothetical protein
MNTLDTYEVAQSDGKSNVWLSVGSLPTPGADEGRQRMFDRIRAGGAEKIAQLLNLDRSALLSVREFVGAPETTRSVLSGIDANGDGLFSIDEIRNLHTGSELSLADFLDFVSDEMKLDMLSPELSRQIGVELPAVQSEPGYSLLSFDGLRNLTRLYVGKEEDANRLCGLLSESEAAAARGDIAAKAGFIGSYIDEVSAQANLSLTSKSATTLITLARTL